MEQKENKGVEEEEKKGGRRREKGGRRREKGGRRQGIPVFLISCVRFVLTAIRRVFLFPLAFQEAHDRSQVPGAYLDEGA